MVTPRFLSIGQGAFYLATGLWPLVDLKSFEKVTGPKADRWLVQTTGLLIALNGLALLRAGLKDEQNETIRLLGMGSPILLGSISTYYSLRRVISKIYLLDGLSEFALAGLWLASPPMSEASHLRMPRS